jgi:hypothetical protein
MVRFVGKDAGVLQDVPYIIKPVLKQYALSVMRKPIPILESVAHMVEFIRMPIVRVKKNKMESDMG